MMGMIDMASIPRKVAIKMGDSPFASTAMSMFGTGALTGDGASSLAVGAIVAGGASIMNRINNSIRNTGSNISRANEVMELAKGFTGSGTNTYDSMALMYSAAGAIGTSSAVMAAGIHGLDPQAVVNAGVAGVGIGFLGGGAMAASGVANQQIKRLAASRADAGFDLAVGRVNVRSVSSAYERITGSRIPTGVREVIRDNPIELFNPFASTMSTMAALGRNVPEDNTSFKRARTKAARAVFPVTEIASSPLLGGSMADIIDQDIIGAAKSKFNLKHAVTIPGTNKKIGGLSVVSAGSENEPILTSKLKLAVTGSGIGSIAALGFDIATTGSPGALSAGMLTSYGIGSIMNVTGVHSAIGYASMLPEEILHVAGKKIKDKGVEGVRRAGILGKRISEDGLVDTVRDPEFRRGAKKVTDATVFMAKKIGTFSTGSFNYVRDGNSGLARYSAQEIIRKNPSIASEINRVVSPLLDEKDKVKLERSVRSSNRRISNSF